MVRGLFTYTILIALLLCLSGCTTIYNPATQRKEFIFVDSATEVAIGRNVESQLLKEHPLSRDPFLQARVRSVGSRIAAVSDRQDIGYRFFVLGDDELNAMTLPGGVVYIYKGLMDISSDDELAYILGHEVGHVAARHIAKKIQSNMTYQLLLQVAFAGFSKNLGAGAQDVARGINIVYNLLELSYSRKDEFEADRLAVKYAHKAGYDPYAAISALEKLKKEEKQQLRILRYFRTHPYVDERISALKLIIPKFMDKR